jgi:hypothetical protein
MDMTPTHHYLTYLVSMPPTLGILLSITAVDIASQRADLNNSGGQIDKAKWTQWRKRGQFPFSS